MHKPAKYFLAAVFLLIGSLTILMLYYGRNMNPAPVASNREVSKLAVDPQKLDADYRAKTKKIVAEVISAAEAPVTEGSSLAGKAKNELLGLTVPSQFKELHLNLVLASDSLIKFFQSGAQEEKLASQDIIKQAKTKYDWLN